MGPRIDAMKMFQRETSVSVLNVMFKITTVIYGSTSMELMMYCIKVML